MDVIQDWIPISNLMIQNLNNSVEGIIHLKWQDFISTDNINLPDIFNSNSQSLMFGYLSNSSLFTEWSLPQVFRTDAPNTLFSFRNTTNLSPIFNEYPSRFVTLRPVRTNVLSSDIDRFNLFHQLNYSFFNPWWNSVHSFLSLIHPYKIPLTGIITVSTFFTMSNYLVPLINKIVNYLMNLFTKFLANLNRYIRNRTGGNPYRGEAFFWWRSHYNAQTRSHVISWERTTSEGDILDPNNPIDPNDPNDPNDPRRPSSHPFGTNLSDIWTASEMQEIMEAINFILEGVENGHGWENPNTVLNTAPEYYARLERVSNLINRMPAERVDSTGAYASLRVLLFWLLDTLTAIVQFIRTTQADHIRFGSYEVPVNPENIGFRDEFLAFNTPDFIIEVEPIIPMDSEEDRHIYGYDARDPTQTMLANMYSNTYVFKRLCWISQLLFYFKVRDPRF